MIEHFNGEHRFLSNFWLCSILFEGLHYPSVEHAYVAAKTINPNQRAQIAQIMTAGQVKKFGRQLALRPNWEALKLPIMRQLVMYKFIEHDDLGDRLLATGDQELIEGNHWNDTYWGVCRGKGENHLGKLLMEIRAQLKPSDNRTPMQRLLAKHGHK